MRSAGLSQAQGENANPSGFCAQYFLDSFANDSHLIIFLHKKTPVTQIG